MVLAALRLALRLTWSKFHVWYLLSGTILPKDAVVEWLGRSALVRKVAGASLARVNDWKTLTVHSTVTGTWLNSGKVKGSERRGLGPAFQMPCPGHDGALTLHCPDGHWATGNFSFSTCINDPKPVAPFLFVVSLNIVELFWKFMSKPLKCSSQLAWIRTMKWATSWENMF